MRQFICVCLAAFIALSSLLSFSAHAQNIASDTPLEPVASLDIDRYMGLWYQIALYPNRFQSQCVRNTTALYERLPNGQVKVTNKCVLVGGAEDLAIGTARPVGNVQGNTLSPPKLQVAFTPVWLNWLPFVWGNYWVIQLADDYRYAVVSEPGRNYLWVLARKPQLSAEDEAAIRSRLQQQGFELSRLQTHKQDLK
jgi:apolipoprotein D and lipocalin family protein